MAKARILKPAEFQKVLWLLERKKHYSRNKCMIYLSYVSGLSCGKIARLKIDDVLATDGSIRDEISLADQIGARRQVVLLPEKLRAELQDYLCIRFQLQAKDLAAVHFTDTSRALFYSQKSMQNGFSANSLSQWFGALYRAAGINGASSHSGRRFFAYHLRENSISPRIIQRLLGHRQLQTSMMCLDVSPRSLRTAVEMCS